MSQQQQKALFKQRVVQSPTLLEKSEVVRLVLPDPGCNFTACGYIRKIATGRGSLANILEFRAHRGSHLAQELRSKVERVFLQREGPTVLALRQRALSSKWYCVAGWEGA